MLPSPMRIKLSSEETWAVLQKLLCAFVVVQSIPVLRVDAKSASLGLAEVFEIHPGGISSNQFLQGPVVAEDKLFEPSVDDDDCWRVAQTNLRNLSALQEDDWPCREKFHLIEAAWYIASCEGEKSITEQPLLPAPGAESAFALIHIQSNEWTIADWYLHFVAEKRTVVIENDDKVEVPKNLLDCELQQLKNFRRGNRRAPKLDSESKIQPDCDTLNLLARPAWIPKSLAEAPRYIHKLERNSVLSPSWQRLGMHRLVYVASGQLEVVICPHKPSIQLLYPKLEFGKVKFSANPLQPNYAKYPKLREVDTACFRDEILEGTTLFVPSRSTLSGKARRSTLAIEFGFIDNMSYEELQELVRIQALSNHSKEVVELLQFTYSSRRNTEGFATIRLKGASSNNDTLSRGYPNWQRQLRLSMFKRFIIPPQPLVELDQSGRHGLSVSLSTLREEQVSEYEVQWRPAHADVALYAIIAGRICNPIAFGSLLVKAHHNTTVRTSLQIAGLASATSYAVRARSLSAERRIPGAWSSWQRLDTTGESAPLAPLLAPKLDTSNSSLSCTIIHWGEPSDDGGHDISEIIIEKRTVHHRSVAHGTLKSDWHSIYRVSAPYEEARIELCNLQPEVLYEFRIRAKNVLGLGWPSPPSQQVSLRGHSLQSIPAEIMQEAKSENILLAFHKFVKSEKRHVINGLPASRKASDIYVTISDALQLVVVHFAEANSWLEEPSDSSFRSKADDFGDLPQNLYRGIPAWAAAYSPRAFDIYGVVRFAEPRDACSLLLGDVADYIVLVERGNCPLLHKAEFVRQAGALGMIIIDQTGACEEAFDNACSPGSSKALGEGFAKHDRASKWEALHMPTVLVTQAAAKKALLIV